MILETDPKVTFLLRQLEMLKAERINWEAHWQEVTVNFLPRKDDIYSSKTAGEEKHNFLYDSSPSHSNELLASALHSMLTNAAIKWFGMTSGDDELDRLEEVQAWLQKCTTIIHDALNGSNFQEQIHEVYLDLGSLGTAPLLCEEDDETDIRFLSIPVYKLYLEENNKGVIDTVFREYQWTLRQIVDEFGIDVLAGTELMDKLETKTKYTVVHAVLPRKYLAQDKNISASSLKKAKFASIHILFDTKKILRESGFRELRYAVPRWSLISGEKLGRSPAMKALPDARMLQTMMKTLLRGAQKVVDPPVQIADDGQYRPLRFTPGGVNYVRQGSDGIRPILTGARVDIGQDILEDVRNRIRQAFFIDQLQLGEGPQMTAEEVRQRTEEKLRLLGPILGRLHNELLKPIIDMVFSILERRGKIPPPPAILSERAGKDMKITYLSAIARVQRTSESQNLMLALQDISPLLQNDPTILDNINGDKAFRFAANLRGVAAEMLNKQSDVKAIRDARSEQVQAQMQQEEETHQAESMSKMAPLMKG